MSKKDKNALKAGVAGATTTVTGIGVAATGSSAAAMTATLGTVGSLVGGGMAAGIVMTAASPFAVGGLCYWAYKKFKK